MNFTINLAETIDAGEVTWKLLHDVYDKDKILPGNLKKAYKLTY